MGSRIQNVVAAGQATIAPLRVINSDAFALRIEPKGKVTVAMELTRAGLDEIELWQRIAFDAKSEQAGFYRGVVLGIAMLIGIVAISLYAVRTIAVFPFASVFIWSAIGFIALESGYLAQINDALPKSYELGPEVRAVIEGLMLIGGPAVILKLWTTSSYLDLPGTIGISGGSVRILPTSDLI